MNLNDPTTILLSVAIVLDFAIAIYTTAAPRLLAILALLACVVVLLS